MNIDFIAVNSETKINNRAKLNHTDEGWELYTRNWSNETEEWGRWTYIETYPTKAQAIASLKGE